MLQQIVETSVKVANVPYAARIRVTEHDKLVSQAQQEWNELVEVDPDFADLLEMIDVHCCSSDELDRLLLRAPSVAVRQSLREVMLCRLVAGTMFGMPFIGTAKQFETFHTVDAEWTSLLDEHPEFKTWFAQVDRLKGGRQTLVQALHYAPTAEIRQAILALLHFREMVALTGRLSFS